MEYKESKIKGIIREAFVNLIKVEIEPSVLKATNNPYATLQEQDEIEINHKKLNRIVEDTYDKIKSVQGF